jgi:very-short-patch-repair endonuclease
VTIEREYKFHPTRKWRADFCLPECKILVEVNGGTYAHMGHSTGQGISRDYEKANEANILGWCYLQFDRASIESGKALNVTLRAIERAR